MAAEAGRCADGDDGSGSGSLSRPEDLAVPALRGRHGDPVRGDGGHPRKSATTAPAGTPRTYHPADEDADARADHHDLGDERAAVRAPGAAACSRRWNATRAAGLARRHGLVRTTSPRLRPKAIPPSSAPAAQEPESRHSRKTRYTRAGGDDRGEPGAELQPVPTAVDPAPVAAHPVLVDLPPVAREAHPDAGGVEAPGRSPPGPTAAGHRAPPRSARRRPATIRAAPRSAPVTAPPSVDPDDVGGDREPPPLGSSPLTERGDAREHRLASGRPRGPDGTDHGGEHPGDEKRKGHESPPPVGGSWVDRAAARRRRRRSSWSG